MTMNIMISFTLEMKPLMISLLKKFEAFYILTHRIDLPPPPHLPLYRSSDTGRSTPAVPPGRPTVPSTPGESGFDKPSMERSVSRDTIGSSGKERERKKKHHHHHKDRDRDKDKHSKKKVTNCYDKLCFPIVFCDVGGEPVRRCGDCERY